jgi:hypothetical protein
MRVSVTGNCNNSCLTRKGDDGVDGGAVLA